jgi:transcriptional regulator with XRE-family HTH domain
MDGQLSQDAEFDNEDIDTQEIVELGTSIPKAGLHRLAAVRQQKGLSCFDVARRIGITAEEVRLQEEAIDLPISTLNLWATALKVPVTELIVEPEEWFHATHLARAQAERLLRVAAKLRDGSRRRSIQRLAQTFLDQLTEIQPALTRHANGNGNGHLRSRSARLGSLRPRANGGKPGDKRREPPSRD